MLKNKSFSLGILIAALIGGIVGFIIPSAVVNEPIVSVVPGLRSILAASPFPMSITTTLLGMTAGGFIGALALHLRYSGVIRKNTDDHIKIPLREEQLDITKNRIKMADVNIHKEINTEEKSITVPVTRENLVVEKKTNGDQETVEIPLSEEHIEVIKHPKLLNRVTVDKNKYPETEVVEETLKRERVTIESKGDAKIRDKE